MWHRGELFWPVNSLKGEGKTDRGCSCGSARAKQLLGPSWGEGRRKGRGTEQGCTSSAWALCSSPA